MSTGNFNFEKKIKELVVRINAVTRDSKSKIVSCQLVNFNSESINKYHVHNYCKNLTEYETNVAKYFSDKNNKSVVTIRKEKDDIGDDLIWYSTIDGNKKGKTVGKNELIYNSIIADAEYDIDTSVEISKKRWDCWCSQVIKATYPKSGGHFAKLKKLKLNDKQKIYSGIFITFSKNINYVQIGIVANICETFLNEVIHNDLIPQTYRNLQSQATRAAISQVMARNTSHNIGAHVMNKLIGDLSSLALLDFNKISDLNYQSTYEKDLRKLHTDIETKINIDDDLKILTNGQREKVIKHKILLDQISLFNNYVKCRMDYLADISFGTPLMQTNKYAYEDLFKELDKVRLLLEHISGLDSFKYEIQFTRNDKKFKANGGDQDDLLVAIPNDILGTQAFYNILENIIRNTAKHSDKSKHDKENPIVFTVNFIDEKPSGANSDIEDILNGFVAVEVYDNIDVSSKINELVASQNKKLNEDILHENKLRSSSLGLVEMDASAAYLRKRDVGLINDDKYSLQLADDSWRNEAEYKYFLKAFNKNNHLAYRFFLLRPAVVLVVTNARCTNKDALKKEGIWVVTPDVFKNELETGKVYPHEFVLYEKQENTAEKIGIPQLIEKYKTSLPIRVMNMEVNPSELLTKSADGIEKECWEKWECKNSDVHIVNGYDSTYSNKFQAVFLDHLYDEKGNVMSKDKIQDFWNKTINAKYIEALSSLAQSKMPDFYKINHNNHTHKKTSSENFKCYLRELNNRNLIKQKIKEAILSKVIVIDERIQEAAENRNFMGISYKDLYKKMNVIVPQKPNKDNSDADTINLSENSFKEIVCSVENYICKQIPSENNQRDYILIHYSILERMYNDKTHIKTKLEEWSKSINVVVTSGRGIPDGLTEKVRFVNLSSVITAFVDIRSKYAISYLLNSSRKSNKI